MQYFDKIEPLSKNTAVALGYFDGVHMGHRSVIGAAVEYANKNGLNSAVFTFHFGGRAGFKGKNILSKKEKENRIANIGVDNYICPDFKDICGFTCEAFVSDILHKSFGAKAVFCGSNFSFGKNAQGNVEKLKELCSQYGIKVFAGDLKTCHGINISSSRIRTALLNGEIESVNEMLIEPYSIDFPVQHGKKLGSSLGTPTINQIYPDDMLIPKTGIYITKTFIDGKGYASATGLGSRPTVEGENITCETFITGYNGDLYGKTPRVEFYRYLTQQKKFDSLDGLKQCIDNAAQASQQYFKGRE